MRLLSLFTCTVFFGAAVSAWAQGTDDAKFVDYLALTKTLRMNGIDAAYVDWGVINPLCLDLDTESNHVAYNRCKFEKAMDLTIFSSDRKECDEQARADHPDSLLNPQPQITTTVGSSASTTVVQAPLTHSDLNAKRIAGYTSCMRSRGWRDANNAMRGRTTD